MLRSSIRRCWAGRSNPYDDKAALKVAGVRQTVAIEPFKPPAAFQPLGGVAVIADNTWAAFQGRKKLESNGTTVRTRATTPTQYKKELLETARTPGKVARERGDVDAEFAKGGKIIDADYYVPLWRTRRWNRWWRWRNISDGKVTAWARRKIPRPCRTPSPRSWGSRSEM